MEECNKEKNNTGNPSDSRIFKIPSLEEVKIYIKENRFDVDPQKWFDFYSAKGWMIGKNRMKDWKAAVRTWVNKIKPTINRQSDTSWLKYHSESKPFDLSDGDYKVVL